jgi:hypothetical protein
LDSTGPIIIAIVRGFVYMETIVRNFKPTDGGSDLRPTFMALRSPEGEDLILNENIFVEQILPKLVLRQLSDSEMAEYRGPFLTKDDRWPTLAWPRQIPIAGEPADVVATVESYSKWMSENDVPKLFVNGAPGAILVGPPRNWKNQAEVTVTGRHFLQEEPLRSSPLGRREITFAELLAVGFVGVIAVAANKSYMSLLLFPELAALAHDVFTRPRGKWASQPLRLIATPT